MKYRGTNQGSSATYGPNVPSYGPNVPSRSAQAAAEKRAANHAASQKILAHRAQLLAAKKAREKSAAKPTIARRKVTTKAINRVHAPTSGSTHGSTHHLSPSHVGQYHRTVNSTVPPKTQPTNNGYFGQTPTTSPNGVPTNPSQSPAGGNYTSGSNTYQTGYDAGVASAQTSAAATPATSTTSTWTTYLKYAAVAGLIGGGGYLLYRNHKKSKKGKVAS